MINTKIVMNASFHAKTKSTNVIKSIIMHFYSIFSMTTVLHSLFKTKNRAAIKKILISKVSLTH